VVAQLGENLTAKLVVEAASTLVSWSAANLAAMLAARVRLRFHNPPAGKVAADQADTSAGGLWNRRRTRAANIAAKFAADQETNVEAASTTNFAVKFSPN
jgi:hypothetical protein